jgi:hypothetical protein
VLPTYILGSMLGTAEAAAGLGFIALGAVVYFGLGLQRKKESAERSEETGVSS